MSETIFYGSKNIVDIGSVGIGTTTPSVALDVYTGTMNAAAATVTTLYGTLAGSNAVSGTTITATATPAAAANVLTVRGSSTTGNVVQFSNTAGGTFIMTNAGRIGVGTSAPVTTLDVFGNVRTSNMTQVTKNSGVGNGVALGNLTFTASWDTAQVDGQNPLVIEVIQTVGVTGGGYYSRVAHAFVYTFNDNSTNPQILSSTQIAFSNLNCLATPTVSTGGRAGTTSVTVTATPGFASTTGNRSYSIHARAICVPPSIGNVYFA